MKSHDEDRHISAELSGLPQGAISLMSDVTEGGVRALIVEDHALLAQALVIALNAEGCRARVAELVSPAGLLEHVRTYRPSVVLLDLDLGELGDGVELVRPLTELGARVLVVSGTSDRLRLAQTLELGAVGFLSKQAPFKQLLSSILDVAAQRPVISEALRYQLMADLRTARTARNKALAPFRALTPRECQVLSAMIQGKRAKAIAAVAVVSQATVRSQIRGVLAKLGVTSQLEAVALARAVGWVPSEPPMITRRR